MKLLRPRKYPKNGLNIQKKIRRSLKQERKDILSREGVVSVGLLGSGEVYNGMTGSVIHVEVDKAGVQGKLPDEIDGFEVTIEESDRENKKKNMPEVEPKDGNACHNDERYDDIPGGAVVSSDDFRGTTCMRVLDGDDTYMLTAAHTFADGSSDNDCSHGVEGTTVYQPYEWAEDSEVGDIDEYIEGM